MLAHQLRRAALLQRHASVHYLNSTTYRTTSAYFGIWGHLWGSNSHYQDFSNRNRLSLLPLNSGCHIREYSASSGAQSHSTDSTSHPLTDDIEETDSASVEVAPGAQIPVPGRWRRKKEKQLKEAQELEEKTKARSSRKSRSPKINSDETQPAATQRRRVDKEVSRRKPRNTKATATAMASDSTTDITEEDHDVVAFDRTELQEEEGEVFEGAAANEAEEDDEDHEVDDEQDADVSTGPQVFWGDGTPYNPDKAPRNASRAARKAAKFAEAMRLYTEERRPLGHLRGGFVMRRGHFGLDEGDIDEHFSKGGGKGGQAVNKTNNAVHLRHVPTNTIVRCHAYRSLEQNRKEARRILQERLEELFLGPDSLKAKRAAKIRKAKDRSRRRHHKKTGEQASLDDDTTATVAEAEEDVDVSGDKLEQSPAPAFGKQEEVLVISRRNAVSEQGSKRSSTRKAVPTVAESDLLSPPTNSPLPSSLQDQ